MEWYNVKSTVRPEDEDTVTSKKYNYIRRNITEATEEIEGETVTYYEYEECKVPKESWGMYEELIQTQADVDYLNMITEGL